MFYKPNYCCNCGEKIERSEWKFSNSRRFCDVCQTEYFVDDWLSFGAACAMALIGLFGLGSMIKAASAPAPAPVRAAAAQPPKPSANADVNRPQNATVPAKSPPVNRQTPESGAEAVEICGALTKKGTACTRRVKGGGRCWQHAGMPRAISNTAPRGAP